MSIRKMIGLHPDHKEREVRALIHKINEAAKQVL